MARSCDEVGVAASFAELHRVPRHLQRCLDVSASQHLFSGHHRQVAALGAVWIRDQALAARHPGIGLPHVAAKQRKQCQPEGVAGRALRAVRRHVRAMRPLLIYEEIAIPPDQAGRNRQPFEVVAADRFGRIGREIGLVCIAPGVVFKSLAGALDMIQRARALHFERRPRCHWLTSSASMLHVGTLPPEPRTPTRWRYPPTFSQDSASRRSPTCSMLEPV
jgi:hypothetical protein